MDTKGGIDTIEGRVPVDDDLIGATEAAAILGITSYAVRSMAGNGRIPHARRGRHRHARYVFRRADILALAASRPARPTDDRSIGIPEAARILRVSQATVLNWAHRGVLPATRRAASGKLPGYSFDPADIQTFMEQSRRRPKGGGNN